MAHQQTAERNIPHLRDIFGFHDNYQAIRDEPPHNKYQDNSCRKYNRDKDLHHTDSSTCNNGNDSAISVGSTSEEELSQLMSQTSTKKKKEKKKKEKQLTETDVKHLERHLSMKKTIRKKIMRDLQQAFVEDPNEFRVEDIPREQLKAELNLQSLSFGAPGKGKKGKKSNGESNFLDFLRTGDSRSPPTSSGPGQGAVLDDDDSGHGSPTRDLSEDRTSSRHQRHVEDEEDDDIGGAKKTSFWRRFTMKGRSKR
ncbi:uncharacterized protein LOC111046225 [Nilaparvata lugens]|uniref:uncharacterized protein LOC111046225 n=1 Tax=Nilaparvata lugens TaxID=108931 RepID=UPI000B98C75A|nr:uncharacterized protein LOC111046225 [Nilaparvata lugens]XP_039295585.1 uncharacterized protein LOC111046225 [Nilaparvata lugens]XP_039295586.1 uncharacterized protein LOC111046225 [Nilaparvata lugens]